MKAYRRYLAGVLMIVGLMATLGQTVSAAGNTNIYRLYHLQKGTHFYTSDNEERYRISCIKSIDSHYTAGNSGNPVFQVYSSEIGNARAIYRLFSPSAFDHFYTASTGERDSAVAGGYKYEGIAFYTNHTQFLGDVPVYRLYNPFTGDHFYTTSEAERDNAKIVRGGQYYLDEGIAFYVNTSAPTAIYRLNERYHLDHIYVGLEEKRVLECGGKYPNVYKDEGAAFSAYAADSGGLTPIKQFYQSLTLHRHFYAATSQEVDFAHSQHYSYEKIAFYADPNAAQLVYRLYHPTKGYLYTTDSNEVDFAKSIGYALEATPFKVDPPCTTGCTN